MAQTAVPEMFDLPSVAEYPYNLLFAVTRRTKRSIPDETSKDVLAGLRYAISTLTVDEQYLLRLRYMQGESLSATAAILGFSEEKAQQLEATALRSLRLPSRWNYIQYGIAGYMRRRIGEEYRKGYHLGYCDGYNAKARTAPESNPASTVLDMPIEMLPLSARAINCLHINGYKSLQEIVNLNSDKIWCMRGLGIKTADEIARAIQNCGFQNTHWDRYLTHPDSIHTP